MNQVEKQFKPVPDVECLKYKGTPDKPDIKIFVSHRIDLDSETIDNPLYIPVRCGAVYDEREGVTMLGDDTGDNISEKRMSFNEFTVMYWAWKNVNADYYGLCHYRRFLSFHDKDLKYTPLKQGMLDSMSRKTLEHYGFLDEAKISKEIKKYDVLVPYEYHITDSEPDTTCENVQEQWLKYCPSYLKPEHFEILLSLIKKHAPEYYQSAVSYLHGKMFRGFNCFIMKKDIFFKMCNFIFPILFEFSERIDCDHFSSTQNRAPAYLGEWLFSLFIYHMQKQDHALISERQLISFENTEREVSIKPAFSQNAITIAMPLNDGNRPLTAVTICSLIEHTRPCNNYDIILLQRSFDSRQWETYLKKQQNLALLSLAQGHPNISIRFYDPKDVLDELDFREFAEPSVEEQYYIHLSPWIFRNFSKIIWLQDGIILNCDIAELNDIDISKNYAAAVKNPIFSAMINGYAENAKDNFSEILQMTDLYHYVSIELVSVNVEQIRKDFAKEDVIQHLLKQKYNCPPPDCFNCLFESKMLFLHQEWNRIECCSPEYFKIIEFIPEEISKELSQAKKPKAINLRGMLGGWVPQQSQSAKLFWAYARKTTFYEEILFGTIFPVIPPPPPHYSNARKFADRLLPIGSKRRSYLKKLLPKGSKRWNFFKKIYYFIGGK